MKPTIEQLEAALSMLQQSAYGIAIRDACEIDAACALLKQAIEHRAAIAKGDMVVVPRLPTEKMVDAGYLEYFDNSEYYSTDAMKENCKDVYTAMINAAQEGN